MRVMFENGAMYDRVIENPAEMVHSLRWRSERQHWFDLYLSSVFIVSC